MDALFDLDDAGTHSPTTITPTPARAAVPAPAEPLPVVVIRSTRRRKSSSARVVDGVIEVRIPAWMSAEDEAATVHNLSGRIERKRRIELSADDLVARTRRLARQYDLPSPNEIRWVTNQNTRWGSCSTDSARIRISSKLMAAPAWVLDYVILHELTHLVEANHGPRFHELLDRYPRAQRAEGFLEAMAVGCSDPRWSAP